MPKNLSLFGKYLRLLGRTHKKGFKKSQITKIVPPKAYGRPPSAASQTGLYHDEDFNYYSKVSFSLKKTRKKLKPNVFKKDFHSNLLNTKIHNIRCTTSALHSMDDMGGFDEYILRTPPQEIRSNLAEKMKNVMYFYVQNPLVRCWGLPWKVFLTNAAQRDPYFARHLHFLRKTRNEEEMNSRVGKFSPYYLPPEHKLNPEVNEFVEGSLENPSLNLWWKESKPLEIAFRNRLKEAKCFDRAYADDKMPNSYRNGNGRGGGGQHGTTTRKRSKTYKYHEIRPY